jgi:metallo-beta-lactamase family protein
VNPGPAPILTFLGATGTVTGSKFLVETAGARVLVDAGLYQGVKRLRVRNREPFPVEPSTIDAVVVTHAHLDHVGYLPALVNAGFAGHAFCTGRTAELARIVLTDSGRLQEEEAEYANAHGFSKHHPAEPLYTEADAHRAASRCKPLPFDTTVEIAPGVQVTLQPAGHILGSAGALLELGAEPARRLYLSGDLGRDDHPVLEPPAPPPAADALVVESTYGDRRREPEGALLERLAEAITRTAARGGMVVIPAFAVDRTEVVLLALARLQRAGRIPALPIYADSPMALSVLDVYRDAIAARDGDVRSSIDGVEALARGSVHEAHTRWESMELNALRVPSIIISASGMATGGRVLHHLARILPDSRNTVVLAGYQAEGTRGRLLANRVPSVKMLGRYVRVAAEIVDADAFSAHADADDLVAWLARAPAPPATLYVVHGEPDASATLADRVRAELGWNAVVPADGERVTVVS